MFCKDLNGAAFGFIAAEADLNRRSDEYSSHVLTAAAAACSLFAPIRHLISQIHGLIADNHHVTVR